jgi:cytochrome o ubiquinol oxidase operon protein cyoD
MSRWADPEANSAGRRPEEFQMNHDNAPGDAPVAEEGESSGLLVYSIGLLLAIVLTAASFWTASTSLIWGPGVPFGLAVLAIAQMGIHLVFFLHITSGPGNTNNALALAFGVLVVLLVVVGSLWIVADLNAGMMPPMTPGEHMQHH